MENKRTEITYGDRTNFSFYDKVGQYAKENPTVGSFYGDMADYLIEKNGRFFMIHSLTDSRGRDISYLMDDVKVPKHVMAPRSGLGSAELDEMQKGVEIFVREIEAAHKRAENSKLVFD